MESKKKISIGEIEKAIGIRSRIRHIVEEYYQIDITTPLRIREYVEARAMYSKLLRDNTNMTLNTIAESIGKNHSTIVHIIRQLEYDMENNIEVNSKYVRLNSIYNESILHDLDENNALVEISISYNNLRHSYALLSKNYRMLMDKHNQLLDERRKRERKYCQ